MAAASADRFQIAARMERLPLSPWHNRMRLIVGTANFSDAWKIAAEVLDSGKAARKLESLIRS